MHDIRDIIRQAVDQGFRVERTAKGHWMFLAAGQDEGVGDLRWYPKRLALVAELTPAAHPRGI